jgi:hypothetical protein
MSYDCSHISLKKTQEWWHAIILINRHQDAPTVKTRRGGETLFLWIRICSYLFFFSKLSQADWNEALNNIWQLLVLWHNLETSVQILTSALSLRWFRGPPPCVCIAHRESTEKWPSWLVANYQTGGVALRFNFKANFKLQNMKSQ